MLVVCGKTVSSPGVIMAWGWDIVGVWIAIADLRRVISASHIRRLICVYNRLGLNNRQAFNRSCQGCFLVRNKSPPIYPSAYQCLDTVRLWNGEDNPMIVNCWSEPSLDNISPSWIAPLCVCTYQARHQFPPCAVSWAPSDVVMTLVPQCPPAHGGRV